MVIDLDQTNTVSKKQQGREGTRAPSFPGSSQLSSVRHFEIRLGTREIREIEPIAKIEILLLPYRKKPKILSL